MKFILKFLLILSALALSPRPGQAQITEADRLSTVRIITLGRSSENTSLPASGSVSFNNGDTYYDYAWGMGTGFVINQDGCVLTNNHVVAKEATSDENSDLILILQRSGDRYFLHRATVDKQDPNADVAILRVPTLKATPFAFSPSDPSEGSDVFSIGFPGSADVAVTRSDREARFATELYQWRTSDQQETCLLYTSPSPRDLSTSRMPSSA